MLRAPSARGPNSIRPSNQPTIFSSARSAATRVEQLGPVEPLVAGAAAVFEERLDLRRRVNSGPRYGPAASRRWPGRDRARTAADDDAR